MSPPEDRKHLSELSGNLKQAKIAESEKERRHSAPPEAKAEAKLREDGYSKFNKGRDRQFSVSKEELDKVRKEIDDARSKKMPDRPPPEPPKLKR